MAHESTVREPCTHDGPTCPAWMPRLVLWTLGIRSAPRPKRSPVACRIEAAGRLQPLPGRLSYDGLAARDPLAAA